MPQLALLAIAGAGLYAGLKWVSRALEAQAGAARRQAEDLGRRASETVHAPKDLGRLEWDADSGVYRPSGQ